MNQKVQSQEADADRARNQRKADRRERIATAVFAAWAAGDPGPRSEELASSAVEWANALMAALDKELQHE